MKLAIDLAKKGIGYTNPNPIVGAVLVKNGRVIGSGYHASYGNAHAERNALSNCSENPKGADMYVTLTPCCHYGKTPPCTDAIIDSGIKRVFIGSNDPNPKVGEKSISILKEHNIEVYRDIEKDLCDELNTTFFHFINNKTPFVVMKYAMTMDGKISTSSGLSKWITGEESRKNVHLDRHRFSSIMVGINTVLKDNPLLTARIPNAKQPLRIVVDTNLRIPVDCNLVKSINQSKLLIATSCEDKYKIEKLKNKGVDLLILPSSNGKVNLKKLIEELANRNIDSLLLEGGSTLNWSMLNNALVNQVQCYISPKIFGGSGKSPVGGLGVNSPKDSFNLKRKKIQYFGDDILILSDVIPKKKGIDN